jgi:hypothetical protein
VKLRGRHGLEQLSLCLLVFLAGCAQSPTKSEATTPYYLLCRQSRLAIGTEVEEFLAARGARAEKASDGDILVLGARENVFKARECLIAEHLTKQLSLSWPADTLSPGPEYSSLPYANGRWVPLATVRFKLTRLENVLEVLADQQIEHFFYFGESKDLVFVRPKDAATARSVLFARHLAGVEIP